MTVLGSSDIISGVTAIEHQGAAAQLLNFRDGKVLLLNAQGMALYLNHAAVEDELGNGMMARAVFDAPLAADEHSNWVERYSAGFIGLHGGFALLITPAAIQLFSNNQDALHNRNELARLDLASFV